MNTNSELCYFNPEALLSESSNTYFFIIYKNRGPNTYLPVYKSEVKRAGPDKIIRWNQVQIGTSDLCNDNIEAEIKFEFFRSQSSGRHTNLGSTSTTLGVLKTNTV